MSPLWIICWLTSAAVAHPGADEHLHATANAPCKDGDSATRRVQALTAEGQLQAARDTVAHHRECGAPSTAMDLAEAHIELEANNPRQALSLADKVLAAETHHTSAQHVRALALHDLGNLPDAADAMIELARTRSAGPEPWLMAAQWRAQSGDSARAALYIDEALKVRGPLPVLVSQAVRIHAEAGHLERAQQLLQSMPPTVDSFLLRAELAPDAVAAAANLQQALNLILQWRDSPRKREQLAALQLALAATEIDQ
jgi:predicted Zn-dependent protease